MLLIGLILGTILGFITAAICSSTKIADLIDEILILKEELKKEKEGK